MDRRNFISFLGLLALAGCKKNILPEPGPHDTPGTDLGSYTVTEFGDELYAPGDVSSIFNGYTDKLSYKPGETVRLFLSGPPNNDQLIRFNDVNGNNILSFSTPIATQTINSKPWVNGFGYNQTTEVKLPENLQSGFYRFSGDIPLICKGSAPAADVTVVFPSNTLNAYNYYGGKWLYRPGDAAGNAIYRSTVVSFSRYNPVTPGSTNNFIECFFRWMPDQNYNTRYITDSELEDYSEIQNSKVVIITGKSEYWTRQARLNIDKFIAAGKNVLVLSGDTMYWQVRYNTKENLMICYKGNGSDPLANTIYETCLWDTTYLKYPVRTSIGGDFNGGGYPMKVANPLNGFTIVQDASPLFTGTGLKAGDLLNLPTIETDGAPVVDMILPETGGVPVIDNTKLNFHKVELLGYNYTRNPADKPGLGTFMVFQRQASSGTVVNVASTDWCSFNGIGGADKERTETITRNMIDLSLAGKSLFS